MDPGWKEVAFAVGSFDGIHALVEVSLVLFGLMIMFFIVYLILGKI